MRVCGLMTALSQVQPAQDRALIEEITQIELTASPSYMFYLLVQCRIALLAHEQQRSQAAAGHLMESGASLFGTGGPAADPPSDDLVEMVRYLHEDGYHAAADQIERLLAIIARQPPGK